MPQTEKETIAFIGLGIMGRPMAANLQQAGYPLRVYNRTASKTAALAAGGAVVCGSPAEAARGASVVIAIVSDTPDVVAVMTGPDGVQAGAAPGTVVIDMSTISPDVTRELAAVMEAQGLEWLDAPVSGGQKGATDGSLTIFCGGKPEVVDRCLPIFQVLGGSITRMGGAGAGQAAKLANQIVGAINILAVSEGLLYASKAGLDLPSFITAMMGGSAQSTLLGRHGPKIAARDFAPGFTVALQQKDLRLVLEAAHTLGVPLLGTSLISQLYATVEAEEGGGSLGNQSLVKALEKLAGYEIGKK
ncbi:MAG TPA: NAD(P)-dependent oxidoreductase [Clostridia bacterium]